MTALYLECNSGISGDMTVAALLDLGANENMLKAHLSCLSIKGFKVNLSKVQKQGISALDFDVILDIDNHDHDMNYLHGSKTSSSIKPISEILQNGVLNLSKAPCKTIGQKIHHSHRGLKEINEIIELSTFSARTKAIAKRIFDILSSAESKAHGIEKDKVYFHEVGAIDSIVDILSIAFCLDDLGIDEVYVPYICEGYGTINCQHGTLPIPVPAVANIVSEHHLNLRMTAVEGELTTPTGAATIAAIKTFDKLPENFRIQKIGIGAGKRDYNCPGILRAMLIQADENDNFKNSDKDKLYKLETNLDDCTSECLGFVMEQLFNLGCNDVYFKSIYMKKNRPAYELNVLVCEDKVLKAQELIFNHTTSIGIRSYPVSRAILKRECKVIESDLGDIRVKECILPNGKKRTYLEYEIVKELALKLQKPYQEMVEIIKSKLKL